MFGGYISAILTGLVPCYSRSGYHYETPHHDRAQAPRQAKHRSRKYKRNAVAIKESPQPRMPVQEVHEDLRSSASQPEIWPKTRILMRLRASFSHAKEYFDPEFFEPIVTDLDTVLFNGYLGNKIIVEWANMTATRHRMLRGICLPYDFNRSGISMVRIRLNKAMFQLDPKEEIWGTVVHEMLHAYLDLKSKWGGLTRPHHGPAFDETCEALVKRLAIDGFEARHVI